MPTKDKEKRRISQRKYKKKVRKKIKEQQRRMQLIREKLHEIVSSNIHFASWTHDHREECRKELAVELMKIIGCPNCASQNIHRPRIKGKGTAFECLSCGETW